jgi:preprotein translocase subunit SecG
MTVMEILILVVHVLVAVGIVVLVLIQHGKGADVGAAFGTGSAGSVFGSAGSANFLSRLTAVLAVVFFLSSMGLTWISTKRGTNKGVMAVPVATQPAPDKAGVPGVSGVPTAPASKSEKSETPVPAAPAGGAKAGDAPK